jgi:hypothetical protein
MVTATITIWAVMRKRSGTQDWPGDPTTLPQRLTEALSPALAASDPSLRPVAAVAAARQPLVIRAGSTPPHGDRGTCTLCHIIVDKVGAVVPAIRAMSSLPHAYRGGICTNCHQVASPAPGAPAAPAGLAAAGGGPLSPVPGPALAPAPAPGAALPGANPAPLALGRPPAATGEGSWLGMEVVPITALTASQYKVAAGQAGVIVAEAEGVAASAGVRAGDVLVAANGMPVVDMQSFLQATQGRTSGSIDVLRGGRIMRGVLGQQPAAPAGAATVPAGGPPPVQPY